MSGVLWPHFPGIHVTSTVSILMKRVSLLVSWVPLVAFFLILIVMFLGDYHNPLDQYFVHLVLRCCLILIFATGLSQAAMIALLGVWHQCSAGKFFKRFASGFDFLSAFPFLEVVIFSVAIFYAALEFETWVWLIALLLTTSTLHYWRRVFSGPVRQLYEYARMHRIFLRRRLLVLWPYVFASFINYFFVVLKRALLPLVFIFVVIDFKKIILPRLIESGMSYHVFLLFLFLVVSLHLLSYEEELYG